MLCFFFFKQKTAYEITVWEFRRVLFRSIAQRLALELRGVRATRLQDKGRGRAIRHAWLESDAAIVAYMDVDLSTDLDGLLPLVAPLISGLARSRFVAG